MDGSFSLLGLLRPTHPLTAWYVHSPSYLVTLREQPSTAGTELFRDELRDKKGKQGWTSQGRKKVRQGKEKETPRSKGILTSGIIGGLNSDGWLVQRMG